MYSANQNFSCVQNKIFTHKKTSTQMDKGLISMVTQEGLEPPTLWFVVKYSNPAELLSHVMVVCILSMVGPLGLEPRTDRLWAGCSNQLSYRPVSIDRKSRKAFTLRELQTFMERKTRLELATPTLARWCSTNWAISAFGGDTQNRTGE